VIAWRPTARNPERLQNLVDKYGDAVLVLRLDVTDYAAAARVVAHAEETFGRIDVVVNNAGYSDLGSFEDTTIDSFRTQIDTNFYGVVNVSKAAVPVLREQGNGHIFQVSSLSVRLAGAGLTAYQAAKWAVAGFSLGLAKEIAPFGVKVTVLEPGAMRTDWGGSSMTIPQPSGPYQPTIGAFAEALRAFSGHEPGNTRRVAQVVRDPAGRRCCAAGAAGGTGTRRQRQGLARSQSERLRRDASDCRCAEELMNRIVT
jgi:NAD(P)-dependent dehydrogenase (short-subunit alcohol dehydrogenase family)